MGAPRMGAPRMGALRMGDSMQARAASGARVTA